MGADEILALPQAQIRCFEVNLARLWLYVNLATRDFESALIGGHEIYEGGQEDMSETDYFNGADNRVYLDKFGNTIVLSPETEDHIKEDHPDVRHDEEIEKTLSTPDLLVWSTKNRRSVLYYKLRDRGNWHEVVVKKAPDGLFISTSFYASKLSKGEWLWRNPEYEPTPKELERNSGDEPPTDSPMLWPDGLPME